MLCYFANYIRSAKRGERKVVFKEFLISAKTAFLLDIDTQICYTYSGIKIAGAREAPIMKRFNVLVVALWLFVFFCSLHQGPQLNHESQYERLPYRVMSEVVYQFNGAFYGTWTADPGEPITVPVKVLLVDGHIETEYLTQSSYSYLADSRMTQTILANSMPLLLFFMLALNIAFYAAKGTYGRWTKHAKNHVSARWQAWRARRLEFQDPQQNDRQSSIIHS